MPGSSAQEAVTVSVFVQRFSSTRRGARLARRLATQRLDHWGMPYGSAISDTVALVVGELSANAVVHGCVPGRDFELRLAYDRAAGTAGTIRVAVSETHPQRPTAPAVKSADLADGGRGLLIVEAVATRWGVGDRVGPGKTVWAELELREWQGSGIRSEVT